MGMRFVLISALIAFCVVSTCSLVLRPAHADSGGFPPYVEYFWSPDLNEVYKWAFDSQRIVDNIGPGFILTRVLPDGTIQKIARVDHFEAFGDVTSNKCTLHSNMYLQACDGTWLSGAWVIEVLD